MGGYGALRLGGKYPQLFSGISGHSSITKLDEMAQFVRDDLSVYRQGNEFNSDVAYWAKKNQRCLPPMRFDCGQRDPLIEGNRQFSQQLQKLNIAHDYS